MALRLTRHTGDVEFRHNSDGDDSIDNWYRFRLGGRHGDNNSFERNPYTGYYELDGGSGGGEVCLCAWPERHRRSKLRD